MSIDDTKRAITRLKSIESMIENEDLSEQAITELVRETRKGLESAVEVDANESDLDYWSRAINEVLECEECDICQSGTFSLENVKKEMEQYPSLRYQDE